MVTQHKSTKDGAWVITKPGGYDENGVASLNWYVLYDNGYNTPPKSSRRAAIAAYNKGLRGE